MTALFLLTEAFKYHARPNVSGTAGVDKLNLDTKVAM